MTAEAAWARFETRVRSGILAHGSDDGSAVEKCFRKPTGSLEHSEDYYVGNTLSKRLSRFEPDFRPSALNSPESNFSPGCVSDWSKA